ncbi:MAG: Holliday junction branch migration protein RuvA [Clostridia bacterium]|nr:Holliday junction branch migration protein RuvA [Clostridia bacterium]
MFRYIKGIITETMPSAVVIESNGVGYYALVSAQTLAKCRVGDEETKIYTYLNVREDGLDLFGFAGEDELDAFKLLISVSGVGPKAAMSILSAYTPEHLSKIVSMEDIASLSRAQGIGAKTAGRIILELRDKMAKVLPPQSTDKKATPQDRGKLSEAENALLVLGYSRSEALFALKDVDTSKDVEEMIRMSLAKLAK